MEKYPIATVVASLASNAQAVGLALNGEPLWLVIIWAFAGWVLLCEVAWRSWMKQRSLPLKTGVCVLVGAVISGSVWLAVQHDDMKLEIIPGLRENATGERWAGLRISNEGRRVGSCKVYLVGLSSKGQAFESYANIKLELGARNELRNEYGEQTIAPGDSQDFELLAIVPKANIFKIYSDQIENRLPPPYALPPGKYLASVLVSGVDCGPLRKSVTIDYAGGATGSVAELR